VVPQPRPLMLIECILFVPQLPGGPKRLVTLSA
jgi:hypothetical protein